MLRIHVTYQRNDFFEIARCGVTDVPRNVIPP